MKRTVAFSIGTAALVAVGLAYAQMGDNDPAAEPVDQFGVNIGELIPPDADLAAEQDYLSTSLAPEVDVSGVERVPSARQNVPYRLCEKTPELRAHQDGAPGDRAYRDISGYLSVTNVITTEDCTCAAKVIADLPISLFEAELRDKYGVDVLTPQHTEDVYELYQEGVEIVAVMCGEY
ncbi:hypothetical protein [Paracoccus albus]|uniref:hypothetical protein n=1 Tax=Paracoccus albus TaxID=3017784 RepID=UPI0022F0C312|nr:hypothetical protein [Paracoccus albus]WBU62215.1 hypothetical protein PAF20_18060 [Paracoccus albus]